MIYVLVLCFEDRWGKDRGAGLVGKEALRREERFFDMSWIGHELESIKRKLIYL